MNDMIMTRREMLKLSGLTALGLGALLSGGLGARAATAGVFSAGEGSSYEAWQSASTDAGGGAAAGIRPLVVAAILAANPHNTQPWLFRASGDAIEVLGDRSRTLPATDPTDSELLAGLGCAIENMIVAAAANGKMATVEYLPASGAAVARIGLSPGGTPEGASPYPAVFRRHTNRGPYSLDKRVPAAKLSEGQALLATLPAVNLSWLEGSARERFGSLLNDATAAIIADQGQSDELDRWWRGTKAQVERYRDGLTLDAQSLPATTLFLAKILPPSSQKQNDQTWLKNTREVHVRTASAFGLLSVDDDSPVADRLQVGRAYQRLHLWATLQGLAMQPMNQVTERIYRDRSLGKESPFAPALAEFTPAGRATLFAFRIGVPTVPAGASPRRPLEDVMQDR